MVKTYVDTGVLIEAYRSAGPLAGATIAILSDPNRAFVTSEFVRLEVLPKPTYYRRLDEVAFYNAFFAGALPPVGITRRLVRLATQRAETFGLSAVDALHVAAAEIGGADELVTAERPTSPLARVTTLRVTSIHPAPAPPTP